MAGSLPASDVFWLDLPWPVIALVVVALAFWLRGKRSAAYARSGEGDSETCTSAEGIPA